MINVLNALTGEDEITCRENVSFVARLTEMGELNTTIMARETFLRAGLFLGIYIIQGTRDDPVIRDHITIT